MLIDNDPAKKVLLRLGAGFDWGDTVMFTVVLKHLTRHRPLWLVDVQAASGGHSCLEGLCNRAWTNLEQPDGAYDIDCTLTLLEQYVPFTDRPSSKVTRLLAEVFALDYDHDLGRYECRVSAQKRHKAEQFLRKVSEQDGERYRAVVIHHQGASSPHRKDLAVWQAEELVRMVKDAGRTPVLIDFDRKSAVEAVRLPRDLADAQMIAAVIGAAEAFVGIDSAPSKLAATTETPSLCCWTLNSPVQYADPAPNVEHLIPHDWRKTAPLDGNLGVLAYFEANYRYRTYSGVHGLTAQALFWLRETLQTSPELAAVRFVVPDDPRAFNWASRKMRGLAQGRPIEVYISGDPRLPSLTLSLWQPVPWIRVAVVANLPVYSSPERPKNTRGQTLYVPEGVRGGYHYLVPNAAWESGLSFEQWLPEVAGEARCARAHLEDHNDV